METKPWLYQNNPITEIPEKYIGFVYVITNNDTGKKYIGKKIFRNTTRIKQKNKTRRKVIKKESDWKTYFGSNEELKRDIEQNGNINITREIIRLCETKSEMSYFETREIFVRDVLLSEEYYNSWVSSRIHKKNLEKIKK